MKHVHSSSCHESFYEKIKPTAVDVYIVVSSVYQWLPINTNDKHQLSDVAMPCCGSGYTRNPVPNAMGTTMHTYEQ